MPNGIRQGPKLYHKGPSEPKDHALFLGRITSEKGAHEAIEAAKMAGIKIEVAGVGYEKEEYWHSQIAPHVNGDNVKYIGEASFTSKIEYLQNAKVLLFPTHYDEVFGYVMIEAMSCGTPVIAFNRGSIPEIIKDGVTGFVVDTVEEMAEDIKKIDTIDRKVVRKRAERFFSSGRMVENYDLVYKRMIKKK